MGKSAHPAASKSKMTRIQKIALWIVLIICAWQFLPLDRVVESFLLFLFGGKVPGTNIILSPNAVIVTVGIALGLGALLLIIKALRHALRDPGEHFAVHGHQAELPQASFRESAMPATLAAVPTDTTNTTTIDGREYAIPQFVVQALVANLPTDIPEPVWRKRFKAYAAATQQWLVKSAKTVRIHTINITRIIWLCCIIAFVIIRRAAITASRYIARQSIIFWRWVSPYLWQFDAWLGKQYRKLRKEAFRLWRELRRAIDKR